MKVKPIQPRIGPQVRRGDRAILHIDANVVGDVVIDGWNGSWGYGHFLPGERFAEYAPLFGVWSLLMHADGEGGRLSEEASRELSVTEARLDAIHSRLFFPQNQEWVDVAQVNIDGELLEWKEY